MEREKERWRDRETERRKENALPSLCLSVPQSLRLSVSLSPRLCVFVSLWHSRYLKVGRFELEVELRPDLDNAWFKRRGEAAELACRVLQNASEANIRSPRLIEEEHTSELQSLRHLVCRLLLEKKKTKE